MPKKVSVADAQNNFRGLLEDVSEFGRVDIVRHGRVVAVVVSPRVFKADSGTYAREPRKHQWNRNHMIPPSLARRARVLSEPSLFDEESKNPPKRRRKG
jgi:prevent-host-death family protein